MIYTDLNNIPENLSGLSPMGIQIARYEESFLKGNKAFLESIFLSEYFGHRKRVESNYEALTAINMLIYSLVFMQEEINEILLREEEVDLDKLYEKYNIECLRKYLKCIADIDTFDLINSFNTSDSNSLFDFGIGTMEITNTFIIR